ncbi:hypothetical protein [Blattabacterium cuenoti]|nr:hypothetical protein [Blattabacterium cuenoti]
MIIKFVGFFVFLLILISGFWSILFLSLFSIYWIISYIINIFIKKYL